MSSYHEKIKNIKEHSDKDFMEIHYHDDKIILKLVDTSDDTIHLMTEWRRKNWQWFGTKFEVKEESTKQWISNVINDPDRILFLIVVKNKKIGQFGIYHYDENDNSIEIDNILMGER